MKKLVKVDRNIPWLSKPGEGRLYITDEMPDPQTWDTAFGFVFDGDNILLARLHDREWDIPGGRIEPGETPEQAALREIWEETYAKVSIVEMIGIQELELFGPKPAGYRWNYPISVQIYYLCHLVELMPFDHNEESYERGFFTSAEARHIPTMINHDLIFEEAVRRVHTRLR